MERLTKLSDKGKYYIVDTIKLNHSDEGYFGEAIQKLAKFENLYDHFTARQKVIPEQMEKLRNENKTKSYKFKELLAEKIMNEMILKHLSR